MAEILELNRDCEAVQIPAGNTVILPAGASVQIAQRLGGAFTVHALGGLFRIENSDADALGFERGVASASHAPLASPDSGGPLDAEKIWEILRACYDPEIPVNIVDLGLVYDLTIEPLPSGTHKVSVKMTLTAPGCGMGATIAGDAQQRILALDSVEEAEVELVWDPPWNPSMISPAGKARLGLE